MLNSWREVEDKILIFSMNNSRKMTNFILNKTLYCYNPKVKGFLSNILSYNLWFSKEVNLNEKMFTMRAGMAR